LLQDITAIYRKNKINNGVKVKRFSILFILIVLALNGLVTVSVEATSITCNSCDDCNAKLNGDYDVVNLTADITERSGDCIPFGANNLEFNCKGHTIDGDGSGYNDRGIRMSQKSNNTLRNCVITDFYNGIDLSRSSTNALINNTITNSNNDGIYLYDSSNNTLTNNTASNNTNGIHLSQSSHNTLNNNTANSNTGSGISIYSSHNNILANNTADSNTYYGIHLLIGSSSNTLINNFANSNNKYGIHFEASHENTANSNHLCSNANSDLYLSNSTGNSGIKNYCDNPGGWNDTGVTGCKYICGQIISGILPADEIWTKESSPYLIVGDVAIEEGNTLTIEPRVEVVFYDAKIYADGTLNAIGDKSGRITFRTSETASSAQLIFRGTYSSVLDNFVLQGVDIYTSPTSGRVNLTNGNLMDSNITLRYSYAYNNEFDNCSIEIYEAVGGATIDIMNNSFYSNDDVLHIEPEDSRLNFIGNLIYQYNVDGGVVYIGGTRELNFSHNTIDENHGEHVILVDSADNPNFAYNIIRNNAGGYVINMIESKGLDFSHNTIHGNNGTSTMYIDEAYDSKFAYNLIYNNTNESISGYLFNDSVLEFNTIVNNDIGVYIELDENSKFEDNNIYGNSEYDAKIRTSYGEDLNLSNNYWGTTNSSLIDEHIYDYYDNLNLGRIIYEPFLTELVCFTKGDREPCDGIVTDFELLNYIDLWVQGEVSDFDLLTAIDNWASR